jgi:hypothetical protein
MAASGWLKPNSGEVPAVKRRAYTAGAESPMNGAVARRASQGRTRGRDACTRCPDRPADASARRRCLPLPRPPDSLHCRRSAFSALQPIQIARERQEGSWGARALEDLIDLPHALHGVMKGIRPGWACQGRWKGAARGRRKTVAERRATLQQPGRIHCIAGPALFPRCHASHWSGSVPACHLGPRQAKGLRRPPEEGGVQGKCIYLPTVLKHARSITQPQTTRRRLKDRAALGLRP